METLAKTFINDARQKQFSLLCIFNNAPVPRYAIAMNINSAFFGSYTENPFRYQYLDPKQIMIPRGGHPIVDFPAADSCCLYVTTKKAMIFEDDIPQFQVIISKITMR